MQRWDPNNWEHFEPDTLIEKLEDLEAEEFTDRTSPYSFLARNNITRGLCWFLLGLMPDKALDESLESLAEIYKFYDVPHRTQDLLAEGTPREVVGRVNQRSTRSDHVFLSE